MDAVSTVIRQHLVDPEVCIRCNTCETRLLRGQRLKNGWKNSGCPWTYQLTPERMLLPKSV
jgi:hypothetical protein